MYKRYQIYITGNVQRVGFRSKAYENALKLNISGMAMYIDHAIMIEAEGDAGNLSDFIDWCRIGPELCTIESIEVTEQPPRFSDGFDLVHGVVSSKKLSDFFVS
ncbi:MAG: acylphosphatase [Bacteroidales bacterium]|nr:acylphosphatase [Bacteroidales bacterium]